MTAQESEYHDVIVIGAGISGLGAANQLKELGYDDVIILEARDRIGGRLWSDRSYSGDSYALDIGASWIHGNTSNPITILAEKYGAEMMPFDDFDSAIIYDGSEEISEERSEAMDTLYKDFKKFYLDGRQKIADGQPDISVQKVVDDFITEKGLQGDELNDFLFMLVWELEGDYAGDASEISIYFDYMGYKMKGREVVFPQGYDKITIGLAEDFGFDKIRKNTIVKEIDYRNNIINIKTNNGNYAAEFVISTLPLGVMKDENAVTFLPPLSEKINAINKLQMGVLNKVYYVFDQVFWDDDVDWIAQVPDEKGHWEYFANLHSLTGSPVLLAFNTGSFAREIDGEPSDEIIMQQGMDVLREIYPDKAPERPLYYNVTRWGSDDFAGGSYSFLGTGSTNADYYELSKPLDGKLFFAGEATEARYPATIHGAYMSGIREALRVQAVDKEYLPLTQIKTGLLPEYVLCKDGLEVALFAPDAQKSICVKSSTKDKLIERGWNLCSETIDEILSARNPKSLSCKTSLLTYEEYNKDNENGDNEKSNEQLE